MILYYEFLLNCLIQDNGAGHLNVSVDLLSFFSRMHWRDIAGKRSFPSWFFTLIHLLHGSMFFIYYIWVFRVWVFRVWLTQHSFSNSWFRQQKNSREPQRTKDCPRPGHGFPAPSSQLSKPHQADSWEAKCLSFTHTVDQSHPGLSHSHKYALFLQTKSSITPRFKGVDSSTQILLNAFLQVSAHMCSRALFLLFQWPWNSSSLSSSVNPSPVTICNHILFNKIQIPFPGCPALGPLPKP